MTCPGCQYDNPSHANFCLECGVHLRSTGESGPAGAPHAELQRALTEALEQQAATAEILKVISRSAFDLQPVLETLLENAARICAAEWGVIFRPDREGYRMAAVYGAPPEFKEFLTRTPIPPGRGSGVGRAALERRPVQVVDVSADPEYRVTEFQRIGGFRTVLAVPMLRDGVLLGVFGLHRDEVRPFTEKQIQLVATFADQAAIAIENVRLFNETKEALEQQTATAEILQVISGSPTDVQPVFDAILRSAVRLCDGFYSALFLVDGKMLHFRASHNVPSLGLEMVQGIYPLPVREGSTAAVRVARDCCVVHIPDMQERPDASESTRQRARAIGHRTWMGIPMLRDGTAVGIIAVARAEVKPFSGQEIALLQTFADQAVIAIENVRLFKELQQKNDALTQAHAQVTESLEQQTATSEILRVISTSPTDAQPVFDTIIQNAVRLLGGFSGVVARLVDGQLHLGALTSTNPPGDAAQKALWPRPVKEDRSLHGQVISALESRFVSDVESDPSVPPEEVAVARARGYRSMVAVPLVRDARAVGSMTVTRRAPGPFSDSEIALLQTFAAQAVIAIENVRLFTELQEKNQALTQAHAQVSEALEQQTATAEILRVISQSPTDVQPVFDAIVDSAVRLCDGAWADAYRFDGEQQHFVACSNLPPEGRALLQRLYPRAPDPEAVTGRAILDRAVIHVPDAHHDPRFAITRRVSSTVGGASRSVLAVPMLHLGESVGVILVHRGEQPRPFSSAEIGLLKTFADQAAIAIENVRLFKELEVRNRELTESLEQQTATSEILQVISQSQTDVQPVFDTIVRSAVRLCGGMIAGVSLVRDRMLYHPANYGASPEALASIRRRYPRPLDMSSTAGVAILTRSVHEAPDVEDPSVFEFTREAGRILGSRSFISVPMLREGEAIGAITVTRQEPGRFSEGAVALLRTFADQAVIAIENARLLNELRAKTDELTQSVEKLTALGEVGRAVSSTLDLETVLTTIVSRAVQLSGLDGGVVFEYDEDAGEFIHRVATEAGGALAEARRTTRVRKGEGVVGETALTLEPAQVSDITRPGAYESRLRDNLIESGVRAILAVPMLREGHLIGCLVVSRNRPGDFRDETIELLRTFATQSALAIQNARLFHEIEDKSRQLEAASRHKSEFLANMSHELRTPLNAIIGFSEVLNERMFGELNEKQEEYLKDIYSSGQHLLSLINDILDLSKIEAGRMELELAEFSLPAAIDNALTLVRERASRRGIRLGSAIDERVGLIRGDERKVKQVLLNLLSNALKFTPEGGRIDIRATLNDGMAEISVADTGVGIAPEDQEAIFEEFRQVGTADKKVEGTGLGLALSRKFIELHGGRIWVHSQPGKGSTFSFTLPAS